MSVAIAEAVQPSQVRAFLVTSKGSVAARHTADVAVTNEELCNLVEAVASSRDREAFSRLFKHFAPRLKGFALRRGIDSGAAEELAQETMLTIWRKAEMFDRSRATVSTWVFTIVRNKRIDLFRREGFPEVELSEVAEQADDGSSPHDQTQLAEAGSHLQEAMRTLPREQLEILQKAFFEEKSHRVIATELGLPLGTVKSRIRLALTRLRAAMPEGHQ
jgi:RNA polymerase sigma-70 factor (ECF subfamily)